MIEDADAHEITELVPLHCAGSVAALARDYAQEWAEIASQLEQRWIRHPA